MANAPSPWIGDSRISNGSVVAERDRFVFAGVSNLLDE